MIVMSTVEEMQLLTQELEILGNERSPFINELVDAYQQLGNSVISQIIEVYKKVREMKSDPDQVRVIFPYTTDNATKNMIIYRDEIEPLKMQRILTEQCSIPEDCALALDRFLRRAHLGLQEKKYREVLKEMYAEYKKPAEYTGTSEEYYWERNVPKSERR